MPFLFLHAPEYWSLYPVFFGQATPSAFGQKAVAITESEPTILSDTCHYSGESDNYCYTPDKYASH